MAERIHIGTSGWVYDHWKGAFYPEDLPRDQWFSYYSKHFNTVEINNSFYQLPSEDTFKAWEKQAPEGFSYAVKGNRYITHMKNLKVSDDSIEKFFTRARLLRSHLGPVLWQLPPHWHANPERLEAFVSRLPANIDNVFEFRDSDWFQDEVREVLEAYSLGFVIYTMPGIECPCWITADVIYLRFHGTGKKYADRYGRERLKQWAESIHAWDDRGHTIYAYFNNDLHANAIEDARTLASLLGT